MTIAERLVQARGSIPRDEVANAVGISLSAISMYENGQRVPRDEIKVKLADYYHTTVQALFLILTVTNSDNTKHEVNHANCHISYYNNHLCKGLVQADHFCKCHDGLLCS